MGLNISPDWFQEQMMHLFGDLAYVKCYLDDILVFSKGSYEDHLVKVSKVLDRLKAKGLQVNADKSFWAVGEVEYLGFILTRQGVKPQPKKVMAIKNVVVPTLKWQLQCFIGLVNFYQYM